MSSAIAAPVSAGESRAPIGGVLTPQMERLIRYGSIGSALIIAVSAMVLSYAGLHDLALDAQVHPRLALLVPIMVDGLQFVGSLGVVYSTLSGLRSWYPWLLMLMGVSISAWGNWQAAPDDLTAKLLHAAAPVILALVLEELLRVMRHKVHLHTVGLETDRVLLLEAVRVGPDEDESPVETSTDEPVPVTVPTEALDVVVDAPPVVAVSHDRWEEPVTTPTPATEVTTPTPGESLTPPAAQVVEAAIVVPSHSVELTKTAPVADAAGDQSGEDVLPHYPADAPFRDQVRAILLAEPEIPAAKIARIMGKDPSYTRKSVAKARSELDAETTEDAPQPSLRPVEPSAAPTATQEPVAASTTSPTAQQAAPVMSDNLDDADPFATPTSVLAGR